MTLVVREREISRDIEQRENGVIVGRRIFEVWDSDDIPLDPGVARNAPDLPAIGDPHPTLPALIAIRDVAERHPGMTTICRVIWFYEGTLEQLIGEDVDIRQVHRETWRIGDPAQPNFQGFGFLPPNGVMLPGDDQTDIGGLSIDINGHPLTIGITQVAFSFSEILIGTLPKSVYAIHVNHRNIDGFQGFPTGTVVYLGSRSRKFRLDARLVTHQFVYDELFHLEQIPQRTQDGVVWTEPHPASPDPDNPIFIARNVYWRQRFPKPLSDISQVIT